MALSPLITRRRVIAAGLAAPICAVLRAQTTTRASTIDSLRNNLAGRLILPDDPAYEAARRLPSFNPTVDKNPRMIVRCASREDVVRAILFAREQSLEIAVRSGGHDVLGASVCDGVVIDLAALKTIAIDAERRIARVDSGVRSGELQAAAQRHGLAAALGCHPGVGVAGLTLGGGLGWLLGTRGAACDNLLGADVITADGKFIRASKDENPDLFWAIRGGGGNFGIVTSFELQLNPVDQVFGGILVLRADPASFLRFYREFMRGAPDELAVEVSIIPGKQLTIIAMVCWAGGAAEGERVLKPLRSFGTAVADWLNTVPYAGVTSRMPEAAALISQGPSQGQPPPRGPGYNLWRGGSLPVLNDACAGEIAAALDQAPSGCSLGFGHYMHGQICRVPANATPLIRTPGELTYFFNASWSDPRRADAAMECVKRSRAALEPFSKNGAYINYLSTDDPAAVRASYGANYARLAEIKRRYDPANSFHRNRNIDPVLR